MLIKICSILPLLLFVLSCRETGTMSNVVEAPEIIIKPDSSDSVRIFIIDHTGKEWDVTHAVNEYGFKAEQFQYGLGPNAINPILEPEFISPGDPGYPSVDDDDLVIGTVINNIVRAYPISIIWKHEIVNDQFGMTYVAVAY